MPSFPPIIRSLVFAVLATLVLPAGEYAAAAPRHPGEYEVKAAFLYNFLKFVALPVPPAGSSADIRICLLGELPQGRPFEQLQDQPVGDRKIKVSRLRSVSSVRDCTVLFIASTEEKRLPEIIKLLNGSGTLTVGDTAAVSAPKGVMINFCLVDKKVRFHINSDASRRAGIKISSKLLKLAEKVYDQAPAGE